MDYEHTQRSPWFWMLLALGALSLVITWSAWSVSHQTAPVLISTGIAITLFGGTGLCFGSLTVRDEGQWLAVRFGPLPVFRTRIAYSTITGVEVARSDILDGWGIHWIPGRGLIYNLWGFDCVRIQMGKRSVRVGTDDVEGLVSFLRTKIHRVTKGSGRVSLHTATQHMGLCHRHHNESNLTEELESGEFLRYRILGSIL